MANKIINKPRGTIDYINSNGNLINKIRTILLDQANKYGFNYTEVPIFEENSLFHRSVGESSDIVQKETFDLIKKGEADYSLRPEFTASITRAVIENKLYNEPNMPLKYSYFGPVFRYERPQAGRYRQITQFGVEIIDNKIDIASTLDAILLSIDSSKVVLKNDIILKLNFLGSLSSRESYKKALYSFFKDKISNMCEDCKRRLEINPLRVLDCKVEKDQLICKEAPKITDFLTKEDTEEFNLIKSNLNKLKINYEIDTQLVRGLDYYTGLVWEIYDMTNTKIGAVGGGGKYSSLMSQLGGPEMEGIGFSLGVERLILSLNENRKNELLSNLNVDYLIINLNKDGTSNLIAKKLRDKNLKVSFSSFSRSLTGALKMADRLNAKYVLIVENESIKVKDMKTREQKEMSIKEFIDEI